ncbi:hypothetical protein M3M35_07195 [Fructilactobacillus myrtifloralis]|uniref:Uncharacterized protein n=1 Tax=Fructilactobacillus myrtifloralis TaxID=2940301 RepID=A0ABY5BNB2_9LACO|nr:hypothetical protein [Fructilactobacillus myrtifloralis]USS85067.1 hypothetical protein M3M35_07195 [Fructilactobacillus myrtifloralis]
METIKQHNDRMARIINGYSSKLQIYLNFDNLEGFGKQLIKIIHSKPEEAPVAEAVANIKAVFTDYFDAKLPTTSDGCQALLSLINNVCREKVMELTGSLV